MHTLKRPLHGALATVLQSRGYANLTPVQRAVLALPRDLSNIVVSSRTGSGKTIAYGLLLATTLLEDTEPVGQGPRAVVLAPTRELAAQVSSELARLYAGTGLVTTSCIGGTDPVPEIRKLRAGPDVVVASPGRLRDHLARRNILLDRAKMIVLDEADELVRRGFREDVEGILGTIASTCKTLMFTATPHREIDGMLKGLQRDRIRIDLQDDAAGSPILLDAFLVGSGEGDRALANVLRYHQPKSALVFCGRRERAAALCGWLRMRGFAAIYLSGALSQMERNRAIAALRSGSARICVATDLAARGLDLPGIDLVINAELPLNVQSMVHRSGRTGRADRPGRAVFLVTRRERGRLAVLLRKAGRTVQWRPLPGAADIFQRDLERIVADPIFEMRETAEVRALGDALLRAHGPERVASAFGKLWLSAHPTGIAGLPDPA